MSAATPISRPARTAPPTPISARAVLSPRGPFSPCGVRARSATIPSRPNNAASPSMWPLATISHSSSGFTDHSKWARSRISGSERSRRSRARITAQKATASSSFSQKVMRASDVPPSSAAPHSAAVARGPYTDTAFAQLDGISPNGICLPTGSPVRSSCSGVMTYGLCPITAVRPPAA